MSLLFPIYDRFFIENIHSFMLRCIRLNHTIKDLKAEISRTEMEKKVEVMKYEEVKRQCTALESKSVSLTQSLDQAVQQGRATNVLELEINNYEVSSCG